MDDNDSDCLKINTRMHWYSITSVLGKGGFGITYCARDNNLQRDVAVKEYFPSAIASRDETGSVRAKSADAEQDFRWGLQRFLEEARLLARFDHPNIVRVLSVFESNGTAYMVMERLHGVTLADVIKDRQITSEQQLLPLTHMLLSGLEHIHAGGVIHRDIKPANIMLINALQPVLIDFGSARNALNDGTPLTAIVSRGYAPFEQYGEVSDDAPQGPWTDVYGLAASLYHVVTNEVPVDSIVRGTMLLNGSADPLSAASTQSLGDYSAQFFAAIDKGLSFEAGTRPQTITLWRSLFPAHSLQVEAAGTAPATFEPSVKNSLDVAQATMKVRSEVADGLPSSNLDVLLVDDEAFELNLMKRVLANLGVQGVATANSGQEALRQLDARSHPPDVIICDLKMPDMDGFQFIRHIGERKLQCGIVLVSEVDSALLQIASTLAESHGLYLLGSLQKPAKPTALRALLSGFGTQRIKRQDPVDERTISAQDLLDGLAADALQLVYLPKVRIADRQVVGVEALARWMHPQWGLLGPRAFASVAEETGRSDELTDQVLQLAFASGAEWLADGLVLQMAVNLFADSLKSLELPERIFKLAEQQGFRRNLIMLEITEIKVMRDIRSTMEILSRLRLGEVGLAVDDFGTGFSSMDQLRRVPFTELKIDRAFVHGAKSDPSRAVILESSATLGKRLGLSLVAEGVEDQLDWDVAAAAGCDFAQGYFIGHPMAADLIPQWIGEWAGRHGAGSSKR